VAYSLHDLHETGGSVEPFLFRDGGGATIFVQVCLGLRPCEAPRSAKASSKGTKRAATIHRRKNDEMASHS